MAWLSGWAKRIEITIPNTNVDSNLTHFPLPLIINDGSGTGSADIATPVFTELGAEDLKIAVTESDGTSELYVEVEQWSYDSGTVADSEAVLWVSKSDFVISSSANTTVYLYYDSSHADNTSNVGVVGSTPGKSVWDSDYAFVFHMTDEDASGDTILDSINDIVGTKQGADDPEEVAGKIGSGQSLVPSTLITLPASIYTAFENTFSMELWFYADSSIASETNLFDKSYTSYASPYYQYKIRYRATTTQRVESHLYRSDTYATRSLAATADESAPTEAWHHIVTSVDEDAFNRIYINGGSRIESTGVAGSYANYNYKSSIGRNTNYDSYRFSGIVDELRLSDVIRSDAYAEANYYAQDDNLISWGSEETSTSIKAVNGVAYANIKAINGVAIGDIKQFNGVSNVS